MHLFHKHDVGRSAFVYSDSNTLLSSYESLILANFTGLSLEIINTEIALYENRFGFIYRQGWTCQADFSNNFLYLFLENRGLLSLYVQILKKWRQH